MSCFLTLSVYGQQINTIENQLDARKHFHSTSNKSIFDAVVLLDFFAKDTSEKPGLILIDRGGLDVYLLNKIIHDTTGEVSDFERWYQQQNEDEYSFFECIRKGVSGFNTVEKNRLQNLKFAAIDPARDIQSSNDFRFLLAYLWVDVFKSVPDSIAPISLKALRSFIRYHKFLHQEEEFSDRIRFDASFNVAYTLDYCLDSLEIFDVLSQKAFLHKEWAEVKPFIKLSNAGYKIYRDVSQHYARILKAKATWLKAFPEGQIWVIESPLDLPSNFKREFMCADLLVINSTEARIVNHVFSEKKINRNSEDIFHEIDLYNQLLKRFPLAEYNLTDKTTSKDSDEANSDIENNAVKILLGMAINSSIIDDTNLNRNFKNMGLDEVSPGNAMGLDLGVIAPDGACFNLQWMAQNSWLNWDSKPHFAYTSLRFGSNVPMFNSNWISSYLSVDYHYENYRVSTPTDPQFIGKPQTLNRVISNDAHNLGLSTQLLLSWKFIYTKLQLGYRWDLSDDRWYSNGISINSQDRLKGNGVFYGVGFGFLISTEP